MHRVAEQFGKKIHAASKALKKLAKPKSQTDSLRAAQELRRTVRELDWKAFNELIDTELNELERQFQSQIAGRREAILRAAREKRIPADRRETEDQVDVFRLKYSGEKVTVLFAGEEVASFKETDAEKILTRLRELRRKLDAAPFSRDVFFDSMMRAFQRLQQRASAKFHDGCVPIKDIHLELLMETALASERFRKRPTRESFPEYPRLQFFYDFARFEAEGMIVGDSKFACKTPSLAQANDRVSIPKLSDPLGPGTQVYLVKIQKVTAS